MDLQHIIINQLKLLENWQQRKLVVGFSGGLDSTVLLFLVASLKQKFPELNLTAVHVNHGLMEQADEWQQHCEDFCKSYNITFKAIKTTIISNTGKGIESAARQARYEVFQKYVLSNDLLLLGHHANDQTETIIFRLLRGSGVNGLSGIRAIQNINMMTVLRPLLAIEQTSLKSVATENNLNWIEDDSNLDEKYDRNFIRKNIIPVLKNRWQDLHLKLSNNSIVLSEQADLLDELAEKDSEILVSENGYLKLKEFINVKPTRVLNFLSWWFRKNLGFSLSSTRLNLLFNELSNFRIEGKFQQNCLGSALLQSRDRAYLIPQDFLNQSIENIALNNLLPAKWNNVITLNLSEYQTIKFMFKNEHDFETLRNKKLTVKFGVENGKVRFSHKQHSSEIRKIFQQKNVPSWLKPHWPVLIDNSNLVSVSGFGHVKDEVNDLDGVVMSCLFCWGKGRHFEI